MRFSLNSVKSKERTSFLDMCYQTLASPVGFKAVLHMNRLSVNCDIVDLHLKKPNGDGAGTSERKFSCHIKVGSYIPIEKHQDFPLLGTFTLQKHDKVIVQGHVIELTSFDAEISSLFTQSRALTESNKMLREKVRVLEQGQQHNRKVIASIREHFEEMKQALSEPLKLQSKAQEDAVKALVLLVEKQLKNGSDIAPSQTTKVSKRSRKATAT